MKTDANTLFNAASDARLNAHAPYSNYFVGAAVLDETGRVHAGCNVENASYPEGICAEANAIGSMVGAGGRRIVAIAIVGDANADEDARTGEHQGPCTPCGGCRQRILEFADRETVIFLRDESGTEIRLRIDELLPHAFRLGDSAP